MKKAICLLASAFCSLLVFAQADDNSGKKVEVIVPDSAEEIRIDTLPAEGVRNKVEYFDHKSSYLDSFGNIEKRALPDSALKKMQQDEDFWYANYAFEKEKEKTANAKIPLSQRTWFQTLMWLIIIGGFAYALILYLSDSSIGLFRKKVKWIIEQKPIEETENIFEINYRDRIDQAIKENNFRLAIRLRFLQMLKLMAGKNMIHYKQDHTNFDYLAQLRNTVYYKDFFSITRNYEYTWYGNFPVDEQSWQIIKNDFENLDSMLSSRK